MERGLMIFFMMGSFLFIFYFIETASIVSNEYSGKCAGGVAAARAVLGDQTNLLGMKVNIYSKEPIQKSKIIGVIIRICKANTLVIQFFKGFR